MSKNKQLIISFFISLPKKLEVEIHREDGGFWAKVNTLDGCVTQADSFFELIEMINDAVFTYFEIPERYRKILGYYVPQLPHKVNTRLSYTQIEKLVSGIIQNRRKFEFSRT